MVRSRVFGIIARYEDQNDHDALHSDTVFKRLADRLPENDDLASQPTRSRFENAVTPRSLLQLEDWFIDRLVNSVDEPPREVTPDVDVFDDPTHGKQQLTLFHGFYKRYQHLVPAIICAENNLVMLPVLLYDTADAAIGVAEYLQRIVQALREKFPQVLIRVRTDSGDTKPSLYRVCEQLDVEYSIGIGANHVGNRNSEELLQKVVEQHEASGEP